MKVISALFSVLLATIMVIPDSFAQNNTLPNLLNLALPTRFSLRMSYNLTPSAGGATISVGEYDMIPDAPFQSLGSGGTRNRAYFVIHGANQYFGSGQMFLRTDAGVSANFGSACVSRIPNAQVLSGYDSVTLNTASQAFNVVLVCNDGAPQTTFVRRAALLCPPGPYATNFSNCTTVGVSN